MNTYYYYDDKFLLTLYAYLKQTESSIVRGLSDKWEPASIYLEKHLLTYKLIDTLNSNKTNPNEKLNSVFYKIYLRMKGKQFITSNEVDNIYILLKAINEAILYKKPQVYILGFLRKEIIKTADKIRKRIICKKRKLLADNVEYYNQHYNGRFYTIEQIINGL
ncbi:MULTISPECIES: hypothetical protein [Proteus]|uniref:Uncharacterized protein n=1 Tax=Proteus appendicitidis TaxID=3034648 RepID=A0ABY8Y5U1_9GAMM|nr:MULTISPECIES: hypothetical protein [unclassified Proteus (in: enterobacteria)]QEZ93083.1 hypothetical protein BTA34_12390 [Proteus sp. CD3]WIV87642.1 hypothetical protein QQS39_14385 [Proteus sp. HZ0627]